MSDYRRDGDDGASVDANDPLDPARYGRSSEPVRHDGVGPTEFYDGRAADPYGYSAPPTSPGDDHDATRTFAAVHGEDDHTQQLSATGPTARTHDTRPEDRFITGSTTATDRHDADAPAAQNGVARRGYHIPIIGGWLLGLVRILIGWQFLWAFLDKAFGLGWATTSDNAWINGGSPTQGYLSAVVDDPNTPFQGLFETFLGQTWADWLFMVGLAGIGIVLILGLGKALTWFAALCGIAMYVLMYLAAWPAGHRAADGVQAAMNPFLDDHLLNAVVLLALAACNAGAYLGLAKAWRSRHAFKDA